MHTHERTLVAAALLIWLPAACQAQAAAPDPGTEPRVHRILLPMPKTAAAASTAPVATPGGGAAAATPAATTTPANGTTPSQEAQRAAIAALMRDMESLRPGGGASTPAPGIQENARVIAASRPASPMMVSHAILPRTETTIGPVVETAAAHAPEAASADATPTPSGESADVLGNLAPAVAAPAATPEIAAAAQVNPALQPVPKSLAPATSAGSSVMTRRGARPSSPTAEQPVAQPVAASVPVRERIHPAMAAVTEAPLAAPGNGNGGGGRNFEDSQPAEQMMHVQVGHTVFVDTRHRLARVYVTDPSVLNTYTSNPNQIAVTALKAGASTLLVWDEAGDTQAYLISSDMPVASLQGALTQAFPQDQIHVEGAEERVMLTGYVGTVEDAVNAGKLASQYTKAVTNSLVVNSSRIKQVRLKVRIVEIDRSKLSQFGFNFFSQGGKNVATTSTGQYTSSVTGSGPTATVSNPLNFSIYSSKLNIGVTLEDLATANIAQILAEPTITAMSGQKASFLAGGEFPFPVVQASGAGSAASVTLQFRQYGVKVEFTPLVNPDGTIDLKVAPEVSALDYSNAVTIAGYTVPAISTRRADTQLVLKDGQTFAISGLLDHRITDVLAHTPGIADVPILGELFKSKNVNHSITELVVIVTPTLVDPVADAEAVGADPVPPGPIPFLDPQKFDHDLPKNEKKQK
jgi:pilus assembly protein CpaC